MSSLRIPTLDATRGRELMRGSARRVGAAVVVLGAILAGGAASAEPPRGTFGGASLWFGTSSRPSECQFYCSRVWGPALEGSLGRMIGGSLAVRGDLWLFLTDEAVGLGVMAGTQLWLGAGASLRASLGGAGYATGNSDGTPTAGLGGTVAITGSYQLWRGGTASADLELRGMLLATPQIGFVTFAFAGYALRWD